MDKSSRSPKTDIPPNIEEDEFWISFARSLISGTIDVLDNRAQFMITTIASLLIVDSAALLIASKITSFAISPQFFFAFSTLCFMYSLFPRRYDVNPSTPDETKRTYLKIMNNKHKWHIFGFLLFFIGLALVGVTSLLAIA